MKSFTPAWLAKAPVATALLPCSFDDPVARRRAVHAAAERRADPLVVERMLTPFGAQERARDRLARPGCAVVVTGQQAGLFGGPLYTLYKAASAIVNARRLTEETGVDCVPVFWLQNEDHDYDEIATATVLGSDGRLLDVTVPARDGDAGRSIAARRFSDDVVAAVELVGAALGGASAVREVSAMLREHYRPGVSPDAAFRGLVEAWFGPHGLLMVDPVALPEAAAPVHQAAITRAPALANALQARAEALTDAGFAVQVHVRPGAPLSFFHPDGSAGARYRIEPAEGGFRLVGTERVVPEAEVRAGFNSTSALLRPIVQDTWLPTAMVVGGPGEIAYFAQLPPLYDAFGLPMPLIVPRGRFRIADETSDRLCGQLGLTPEDLGAPRESLLARLPRAAGERDDSAALEASGARLVEVLAEVLPRARALDAGLGKAVEKTGATVQEVMERLVDRYRRTVAQQDEVGVDRLDRLLARLVPRGAPQERVLCWPWPAARFGPGTLVDAVLAATVPFDGTLRELRP